MSFNRAFTRVTIAVIAILASSGPHSVHAQATGVPIERAPQAAPDKNLIQQAEALRKDGKLLSAKAVAEQLKAPQPAPFKLPKAPTAVTSFAHKNSRSAAAGTGARCVG